MAQPAIRFEDGPAYERGMARWSAPAGDTFLDWLAPQPGQRWIDIGCGTGAFTERLMQRCAPAELHGIDPSEAQLASARTHLPSAHFQQGDAMALPYPDNRFDAATMALVIFFVPDPAKGVAEMARVVRPGGTTAAYAWDLPGGGFPFHPIQAELRASGHAPLLPPSIDASREENLRALWTGAGLEAVETRTITVQRTFDSFDDFWSQSTGSGSIRPVIAAMSAQDLDQLKQRLQTRLSPDAQGRITRSARANAVKGRVPT